MADDGFKLEVDSALAERLKLAAAAAGESVQDFALQALRSAADDDWAEDYARIAEYEATGRSIPVDQAMAEFRAAVEARFAKK
jgi:uncharacterized protein (DUF1778 family)